MSQAPDPIAPPPLPAAPVISYAVPAHLSQASRAVWREGMIVVVDKSGQLPHVCVKCGATPEKVLKRNLVWYPSIAYLGLLLGLLPFAILAVILQKKATVLVPICADHARTRRRSILIAWGIVLAAIGISVAGFTVVDQPLLLVVGIIALIVAIFIGMNAANPLKAKKIDQQYAYLKGACEQFLSHLSNV